MIIIIIVKEKKKEKGKEKGERKTTTNKIKKWVFRNYAERCKL